ncbi:MAG: PPC domain-containing DNA-binding protein [Ginsengibacter sp.]
MVIKNDISYAARLLPGDDLKKSIEKLVKNKEIQAGWIAGCVGSLTAYSIRFANQQKASAGNGYFEILNVNGTVSTSGLHLHITIADENGVTIGGHLMEGCKVYTTAEIILVASPNYLFTREKDGATGWKELKVNER